MGKKWFIVWGLSSLVLPISLYGQYNFHPSQIAVSEGSQELSMPWVGGLNSIQYNVLDLNFDTIDDLVLFDRTANKLYTFIWESDSYIYAPEYEIYFPDDLVSWVLLRDYNCDGLNDLFTDTQQGMRVFENAGTDPISWKLTADPVATLGTRVINLFFNATDIVSIDDLDGDGDLDVLAYNFATGENIDFHQNMSMENNGSCGLDFVRITRNYGGISECDCGEFSFSEPCPVNGRLLHSGGKSLLSIDLDNDGDMELLTGEETCEELTLMVNEGDFNIPSFSSFSDFFGTNDNDGLAFSTAYNLDLDSDGLLDLAISSNLRENDGNAIDFASSSLFYKNIGTNSLPKFDLIESDFLQNRMIDVGENSHPAFADYDKDGDQDLFIGATVLSGNSKIGSTLFLYENTGSANLPSFTFRSNDYLSLSTIDLLEIKPQFIDLNDDGSLDLVFTANSPVDKTWMMYYLLNTSSSGFEFDVSRLEILSNLSALADHPILNDIDEDGAIDLLIGRRIGKLEYYKNLSSTLNPDFVLEDLDFLQINTSITRINLVPFIYDLNNDGEKDLITSDGSGEISIYEGFLNEGATVKRAILRNTMVEELQPTNLGRISWPVVTDLYNTGSIDLAAGTIPGGIILLQDTSILINPNIAISLSVYPNPSSSQPVTFSSNANGTIQVFNMLGQMMSTEIKLTANQPFLLDFTLYPEGVYVVRFISLSGGKVSKRLLLTN